MDLYQGTVGVLGNQVHDFSPGIPPSGLFWTQAIPRHDARIDFEEGRATIRTKNLSEQDAGNVLNALQGGATTPATVSFEMRWRGSGAPLSITDPQHGFRGRFFISDFTIAWSAKKDGFTFESDPAETSSNLRSVFGRERNGIFFAQEDDEEGDE
jgi:hypothetical protein